MRTLLHRAGLALLLLLLASAPVWAQSDGKVSEELSKHLYCDIVEIVEGDVGILIGLILVFMALWAMIKGAKPLAVLPLVIVGTLVTGLPTLIESTMTGLSVLLEETGISTVPSGKTHTFEPPNCSALTALPTTKTEVQPNTFYPGKTGR